jgi:hypothetical protein
MLALQLVAVVIGAAAVLLHHLRQLQFDALVGGEALVAGRQRRRRRTVSPSSFSRVSTTWVFGSAQ